MASVTNDSGRFVTNLRALAVLLCVSCQSAAQTYKQDVQTMCDGPALTAKRFKVQTLDEFPGEPASKTAYIWNTVDEKLRSDQGRALWHSFASASSRPKDRASRLADEASRLGIAPCPQVDWFARIASLQPK
jgi:hypothetical protein